MAQLFPTNERSFLLLRLASNCVHVAVPSSLWNTWRLCFLRIVVARHERDIYTRRRVQTMVRELRTFLYDDRSFILRCNYVPVVFNAPRTARCSSRRARFRLGHDLFVTHHVKQAKYACVCWPRAFCQWTRCNKSRTWSSLYSPTIDYYAHLPSERVRKKKNFCPWRNARRETKALGSSFRKTPSKERRRYAIPRERCHFLRNASPSFLGRQPGNDPYEMVLRAGTEQYTSCATGKAVGIKSAASWLHQVRQRTNIHRYFVLTRLYEQSAGAAPRKLFVPQTHLAPFREILLE